MFEISTAALVPETLQEILDDESAGARVVFEGRVRNHNESGRRVLRMEYQAYDELARKEGARVLAEARERFQVREARCSHRVGMLEVGEMAVWVGIAAAHRRAAFDACRYVIDEVKKRVPIWKKEYFADGESEWVKAFTTEARSHGGGIKTNDQITTPKLQANSKDPKDKF